MKFFIVALCLSIVAGHEGILSQDSCVSQDLGMRALLQTKVGGPDCETMCKRLGAYPNCQCPGFDGEPAESDDTRKCFVQDCQDPKNPCPNDAFVGCVKEHTKSFLQWEAVLRQVDQKFTTMMQFAKAKNSCSSNDAGMRALLQTKVGGPDCETMCKRLGAYPNCQCPGFDGEPAESDDTRKCFVQDCQDPKNPCPNDAFVGCVKEHTKSFLQWEAVLRQVDQKFTTMMQFAKAKNSCSSNDAGMRALLQTKVGGPDCETMCKRLGAYPNCQCPGFDGEPAESDDTRKCFVQDCQDPKNPCPNDAFVGCVKEHTKSFLQWDAVLSQVDQKFAMMMQFAKAKRMNSTHF